jgi:hypothetical protein
MDSAVSRSKECARIRAARVARGYTQGRLATGLQRETPSECCRSLDGLAHASGGKTRRGDLQGTATFKSVYNVNMCDVADDWSPADSPYAIAVSEARWWLSAVNLTAGRLNDPDDPRARPMSSRQVDARLLVFGLSQLLAAEHLEQHALEQLAIDPVVGQNLAAARESFLDAVPGIQDMRNALTHFEDWSRGEGRGPQRQAIAAGGSQRDVARDSWGFAYDPSTRSIRLGLDHIEVDTAMRAAGELHWAIYSAAVEVDRGSITK